MDAASLAGLILIVGMIVLIGVGLPIAIAIALPCTISAIVLVGASGAPLVMTQRIFAANNSFVLLAIPFFILAGVLMNNGGIAGRLVDLAKVLVGRAPAPLAQTSIAANAIFGAVSGASVASAAAVGTILTPRMKKEGYDMKFAATVNVAASPAGMLIPPSNTFIVYSLVSSTSVSALFMAGIIPGLMWAAACALVVAWYARRMPDLPAQERVTLRQALIVVWRALPALVMMLVVIGGLLAGYFTATESAVIAVLYALVFGLVTRSVVVRDLYGIVLTAARTTGVIMLLVGVSGALSWILAYSRIPEQVADFMLGISTNPTVILIIIMIVLLVAGTVMDPTPEILIFTPIFLPVVTQLGIDPIHFGAMMVFNMSLGNISPPVGNNLFVGAKVGGVPVESVFTRILPFFAALVVALFLVVFIPELSLWLPTMAGLVTP